MQSWLPFVKWIVVSFMSHFSRYLWYFLRWAAPPPTPHPRPIGLFTGHRRFSLELQPECPGQDILFFPSSASLFLCSCSAPLSAPYQRLTWGHYLSGSREESLKSCISVGFLFPTLSLDLIQLLIITGMVAGENREKRRTWSLFSICWEYFKHNNH